MSFCSSEITHGLAWHRTQTFAMTGRRYRYPTSYVQHTNRHYIYAAEAPIFPHN